MGFGVKDLLLEVKVGGCDKKHACARTANGKVFEAILYEY